MTLNSNHYIRFCVHNRSPSKANLIMPWPHTKAVFNDLHLPCGTRIPPGNTPEMRCHLLSSNNSQKNLNWKVINHSFAQYNSVDVAGFPWTVFPRVRTEAPMFHSGLFTEERLTDRYNRPPWRLAYSGMVELTPFPLNPYLYFAIVNQKGREVKKFSWFFWDGRGTSYPM